MSQRTRAQERADEIDISPTELLAEIEQLPAELEATPGQGRRVPRPACSASAPSSPNYRRRTTEERERELGLASEDLLRKVLAVADDFDRAIEARPEPSPTDPGSRASPRSTASCAACSRARA